MAGGGGDKVSKRRNWGLFQLLLRRSQGSYVNYLTRKFQTDWFNIPLLREAEPAIRLGTKPQSDDLAGRSYVGPVFFFLTE